MKKITEKELDELLCRIKADKLYDKDSYGSALSQTIGRITVHTGDDINGRIYTETDLDKIFKAAEREYFYGKGQD